MQLKAELHETKQAATSSAMDLGTQLSETRKSGDEASKQLAGTKVSGTKLGYTLWGQAAEGR